MQSRGIDSDLREAAVNLAARLREEGITSGGYNRQGMQGGRLIMITVPRVVPEDPQPELKQPPSKKDRKKKRRNHRLKRLMRRGYSPR